MTTSLHRGVWVADRPLDLNEGAKGSTYLTFEMPEHVLEEYEWEEDEKPYREFLVPASGAQPVPPIRNR